LLIVTIVTTSQSIDIPIIRWMHARLTSNLVSIRIGLTRDVPGITAAKWHFSRGIGDILPLAYS
jgi:hypothetical protein